MTSKNIHKETVAASRKNRERDYWLEQFSGELQRSAFPTCLTMEGKTLDRRFERYEFVFPMDLASRISKLAGGAEPQALLVLEAGIVALLARYSGNLDIVIGTTIMKQQEEGEYTNTVLPLRHRLHRNTTFKELLIAAKDLLMNAVNHQSYPFSVLVQQLELPEKEGAGCPLFDVAIILDTLQKKEYLANTAPNILFGFTRDNGAIQCSMEFNDHLYDIGTIKRIADHAQALLQKCLEDVNTSVFAIDFLLEEEKDYFLKNLNGTHRDFTGERVLHRRFASQAQKTFDIVSIVEEDLHLTYRELDMQTGKVAWMLRNRGVGPEAIVAVDIQPSIAGCIALLGVLKAGGAYLPLDPDAPESRTRLILNDCSPMSILTGKPSDEQKDYFKDQDVFDLNDMLYKEYREAFLDDRAIPSSLAYAMYTSGTTGVPKGVLVEHGGVVNLLDWYGETFGMEVGLHVMQLTDYTFDPSIEDVFGSLLFGATVFTGAHHLVGDPEAFCDYVNRRRIGFIDFVPSILGDLLLHGPKLASLSTVISGGEALPEGLKDKLLQKGYRVYNNYGPTELTVDVLSGLCEEGRVTLGKPIANANCYVLNEHSILQPLGAAGELCVSGWCVARGYANNPSATADAFVADPFASGKRMYKTGDLARVIPGGEVQYLGRLDRQIKINGVRIEPGDIEAVLDGQPQVTRSAVVSRRTSTGNILCSYIVPAANTIDSDGQQFFLVSVAQEPSLIEKIESLHLRHWPAFFVGDPVNVTYWKRLYTEFPQFQLAILDEHGTVAAAGNTIPLHIDDDGKLPTGWDGALLQGMKDKKDGARANTLCGLVAIVDPAFKGKGMSYKAVGVMKRLLVTLGFNRLIIPVRPTFKENFPDSSIVEYCALKNSDGFSQDPWLRVHQRLGGTIIDFCPESQVIEGTVEQWTIWTGKEFKRSGRFTVPGAMQPVEIDIEKDTGVYIDQAVWVEHTPMEPAFNNIDPVGLKNYLLERLPGPMIPSRFYFISRLPLGVNGKVDYRKLPDIEDDFDEIEMAVPRTRIERKLADIWAQVLNIDRGKIGVRHNFFELGGHSLRATILVALLQKQLHANVSMKDIFQKPTIRELAQFIEEKREIDYISIFPSEKREYYPLSSAQKRLYFIHQIDAGGISYNMPMILRASGSLDAGKLSSVFRSLVERHETFRTSFFQLEGEGVFQRVHEVVDFSVEFQEAAFAEAERLAHEFVRPFDLSAAPLLRVNLVKTASDHYVLMIDMHHIVSDGTSIDLFIAECLRLYHGETLPPLALQYRDFCLWQKHLFESRDFLIQEDYWLEQFESPVAPLGLPTDFSVPSLRTFEGGIVHFNPGAEIDRRIYKQVEETKTTVFMYLLAVYYVLLFRYTGRGDIVVGTKLLGRRHADVHDMIGMFINMLALRNYPSAEKSFSEFLSEVRDNTVNAFENQDYQFEELVAKLGLGGRHGRNPLFDTVFALVNLDPTGNQKVQSVEGLSLTPHTTRREISNFDLHMEGVDANGTIMLQLGYSKELYKRETIETLCLRYREILEQVTAAPDIKLKEIKLSHQLSITNSKTIAGDEGEFGF